MKQKNRYFYKSMFAVLAVTTLFLNVVVADEQQNILPTEAQSRTTIEIIDRLGVMHYRDQALNDDLSRNLLEQYVDKLDPSKSYFTQSDIDFVQKWSTSLDDMLKQGDLSVGFEIYNLYRTRASERLQRNLELLESDYIFDFDQDETINLDPESRTWALSMHAADDYWRKRIKDSLIRLIINDKNPEEARELLVKRYKTLESQFAQRNSEDVFEAFINSFTSLYDPHTSYFSPSTMENFKIAMSLSLEGIGAVLQHEDEHTKVVSVVPKGPADKQGILQPGDKITSVAQDDEDFVNVIGWRLDDVVKLIRGPKDSIVRLEVIPAKGDASSSTIISIVRDKIQLEEQAAQSKVIEVPAADGQVHRFGVIEVPTFYMDIEAYQKGDLNFTSTSRDVQRLIDELSAQDIDGLLLDLRNNGGGFLHEATMLTDLFIDPGPVVQVRHAKQRISRHQRSRNRAYYSGPLVVLINRLSASASEIFAGAIQDYQRGLVIGTQSFGKGTVQSTSDVYEGMIKLTESKFYRVSGGSTQHRGVIPDVALPALFDKDEVGESNQKTALPWDEINPVPHRKYANTTHQAAILQGLHNSRLESDPDLLHLTRELSLAKSQKNKKVLSLNLDQRRKDKEKYEQELLDLENARRKAKQLPLLDSYAKWREERDQNTEEEEPLADGDPILFEAGHVFSDYLRLGQQSPPALVKGVP